MGVGIVKPWEQRGGKTGAVVESFYEALQSHVGLGGLPVNLQQQHHHLDPLSLSLPLSVSVREVSNN